MRGHRSIGMAFLVLVLFCLAGRAVGAGEEKAAPERPGLNLAPVATPTTSFVSGHETIHALNDGFDPAHSNDKRRGAYGNWPRSGTQWVEYGWSQPITTRRIDVYWFDDRRGVRLPSECRLLYWDGAAFTPVKSAEGLGRAGNQFNTTTFAEVTTSRLRLEMDSEGRSSTGILEWRVYDAGASPNFPPKVKAGVDRVVMLTGRTYLSGKAMDDGKPKPSPEVRWSKDSGPGDVTFEDSASLATAARFAEPGGYILKLTASDGEATASDTLQVTVEPPPPASHLTAVPLTPYRISSQLWRARTRSLIVNWIPYCIRKIEDPELKEGGLDNFIQAANRLAGRPARDHRGYPFSNAWVYNTIESICTALMVEAPDDPEVAGAQAAMRKTLEDWIPKILAAQEPDGYLHTQYTISGRKRWSNKADHEGYNAGYFLEAAMAHHAMTGGKDLRLYLAARKLADLWCESIGPPPKRQWYEGHQAMEMALAQLARFVDQDEGPAKGKKYLELARFLLDSRRGGEEYDQSHVPVVQQYEAVGHAVRAVYSYSGMADIALAMQDIDYHSAVKSLWSSIVNRKYYVTGGVGSGETAEGFGGEYSLPNRGYCESCANCGELFFQHRLHLLYRDARYVDLLEETFYNAILGDLDLEGRNFTYTNPLDSGERRYPWHVCPCCVGNIPRTLLRLPTWMYSRGGDRLYVNLFIGSTVTVEGVAGTSVQLIQATDYPWKGEVSITVNPAASKRFSILIRSPDRSVSELYSSAPAANGLASLSVNGAAVTPDLEGGYAVLTREWKAGDRIDLALPMVVQRVKASPRIAATAGRVALKYGPLIYNLESVDQEVDSVLDPASDLKPEWSGDLLGGVMVINGTFAGGARLTAIPNFARLNRGGRSVVWVKDR